MFREVEVSVAADGGQDLGGMGLEQPSGSNHSGGMWVSLIPQSAVGVISLVM